MRLQRQQGRGQPLAVTLHDLVQHGRQARQLVSERDVVAGLDVRDQVFQRSTTPVGGIVGRGARGTQLGQQRVGVQVVPGAGFAQGNPAAAAEVDSMALKHLDGGGLGCGNVGDRGAGCDLHGAPSW